MTRSGSEERNTKHIEEKERKKKKEGGHVQKRYINMKERNNKLIDIPNGVSREATLVYLVLL